MYTYRIELELQNEELLDTQQQLQEVSQDYLDFYNVAPIAYVTLDGNSRIRRANNALADFLGVPKQPLLQQRFTDYVQGSDQDSLYLYRQALISSQKPNACEIRLLKPDGQTLWVKCEGFSLSESPSFEINLILTDISERKHAERLLQDLFNHQEIVREGERAKVENEIHEGLGSILMDLKMELIHLRTQLPEELSNCHEKCAIMNGQLDVALHTITHITEELRPSVLDHFGLLAAVEQKIKDFRQQTGIACNLILPEQPVKMDKHRDIAIFRIVEEALANIALHAKATKVNLTVETDGERLRVKITDNGCGMTDAKMHQPGKYGISVMQERARQLGGKVTFDSHTRKGTTLLLTMPLRPLKESTPQASAKDFPRLAQLCIEAAR